jgi:hypothetical protein
MGNCVTSKTQKQAQKKRLEADLKHSSIVVLPIMKSATKPESMGSVVGCHTNFQTPQSSKVVSAQASTAVSGGTAESSSLTQSGKNSLVSGFRPRGESNASDLTAEMNPVPKPKKISYLLNVNGIEYKVPLLDSIEASSLLSRRVGNQDKELLFAQIGKIEISRRPRGGSYNLDVIGKSSGLCLRL